MDAWKDVLVSIGKAAQQDQITLLGAALAYYALFSLGPLLFLIVTIAGLALGEPLAEGRVLSMVEAFTGASGAAIVRIMLETSNQPHGGRFATGIGLASLLAGAIGMVTQLKSSLNTIWGSKPRLPSGLFRRALATALSYVVPILAIIVTGFLLVVSLTATALLEAFGERFNPVLPGGASVWLAANQAFTFAMLFGALSLMYRYLADVRPPWPAVVAGSLLTAGLFLVGKYAFGIYLAHSHLETGYGAAGSLVLVLVWVYYSSQILFVGAEFIKVDSRRRGAPGFPASTSPCNDARA